MLSRAGLDTVQFERQQAKSKEPLQNICRISLTLNIDLDTVQDIKKEAQEKRIIGRQWLPIARIKGMIEEVRKKVKTGDYRLTVHAFERCVERDIWPDELKKVIISGEIIESYPEDKYGPSCLIQGLTEKGGILHV